MKTIDNGYIRIGAGILDHWIWQNPEYFKWWLDLLLMASSEVKSRVDGRRIVRLGGGQIAASLAFLSRRWNRSRTMVQGFLRLLKAEGMISRERHGNVSVITVYPDGNARPETHLETYPETHLTDCNTGSCTQGNVHLETHLETHLGTHTEAHSCDENSNSCGSDSCVSRGRLREKNNVNSYSTDSCMQGTDTVHCAAADTAKRKEEKDEKETPKEKEIPPHTPSIEKENTKEKEEREESRPFSLRSKGLSENGFSDQPLKKNEKMKKIERFRIDRPKFLGFFNAELEAAGSVIPRARAITDKRERHLLARFREYGEKTVEEAVRKAAKSDFLNGKNRMGWIADFSWLFLPENFAKVTEGSYDNGRDFDGKKGYNIKNDRHHGNCNYDNDRKELQAKRRWTEVCATSAEDYSTTF